MMIKSLKKKIKPLPNKQHAIFNSNTIRHQSSFLRIEIKIKMKGINKRELRLTQACID